MTATVFTGSVYDLPKCIVCSGFATNLDTLNYLSKNEEDAIKAYYPLSIRVDVTDFSICEQCANKALEF